ncbi:MAG: PDZ domain-containing protein, partial [Ferruginibacter sp.]
MKKIWLLCICALATTSAFSQLNEKVGIGVRLRLDSSKGYKIPLIIEVVADGSAKQAGLLAGDIISAVNEKSTKNMALKDVVAMIVGEAGTRVKLNIDRKNTTKSYTVLRGTYKYAVSFYQTADPDNSFCTALTKLMNDAGYDFVNSMDTISAPLKNGNYTCKIRVPGVESTEMNAILGISCEIIAGSFATSAQANAAGAALVEQLKNCFPDFYYDPEVDKTGAGMVNIGQVFSNGYESPVMQLFPFYDKARQVHKLELRINGGKQTRYYSIGKKAESTAFANSLRTIYKDIANDFRQVKGTRHETQGGLFSSGSSWYDIIPVPDGAKSCSLAEGTLSAGAKNCSCGYYQGASREDAVTTFNNLFEKTRAALGSD